VYVIDDDVYIVECVGRIAKASLLEVVEAIYARHPERAPRAVLFFEAPGCKGYDRDVLTFYEQDAGRAQPGLVGVITENALVRMIVRAVGVGFRVFTHRTLAVYDDLPAALADLRARALRRGG
jgi:hypothetical protein